MDATTGFTTPSVPQSVAATAATLQFGEATPEQRRQIMELLGEHKLPFADITEDIKLYALLEGNLVVGSAGLEPYGTNALLRSVAVVDRLKGKGLGAYLYVHVEEVARKTGITTLYLLTTTAEKFFTQRGYKIISRSEVPPVVATSGQFNGICPASATMMAKAL